jgi:fructosamine-3-kinase
MALPPSLSDQLAATLGGPIEHTRTVHGGDINQAAHITCNGSSYFVKWHAKAPPRMFPAEAHGLRLMAATGEIRVPAVIAQGDETGGCPAFLVLEWIDLGNKRGTGRDTMAQFGEQLAAMHRHHADQYGLDQDNFIGRLPQPNTQTDSWAAFYRDHRIGYQMEIARKLGRLPKRRENLLTRLMDRLPDLLDDDHGSNDIPASLIHGDLWGGNYLVDAAGSAVLIDPAVCYGHREMDLAMSELFGGFSSQFYSAYRAAYPCPGYEDRRALYQLYYIIVHLNHFGESYGGRVDSLAARYVGRG